MTPKSKLTNPRVIKLLFLPARTSTLLFPPPLLDLNPSIEADEVIVFVVETGVGEAVDVGLGVGFGLFVGLGVAVGEPDGVSVSVGVGETVSVAGGASLLVLWLANQYAPTPTSMIKMIRKGTRILFVPDGAF